MKALNRESGFSFVEVIIGIGITSFLGVIGYQLLKGTNTIFSKTITRISYQSDRENSFRKIRQELENSPILQHGVVVCSKSVVSKPSNEGSISLRNDGDSLNLAFTDYRSLAARSKSSAPNELTVTSTHYFQKGTPVFLQSLDQDGIKGIYVIKDVKDETTLELEDNMKISSEISCSVSAQNPNVSTLLSAGNGRKFHISRVSFVNYSFSKGTVTKTLLNNLATGPEKLAPLMNFQWIKIDYKFSPEDASDGLTGKFQADISTAFKEVAMTGAGMSKNLLLSASYYIKQDKVNNTSASIEALSSDLIYPSCVVSATSVKNHFAKKCPSTDPSCPIQDEFRNFYKIDTYISEAESFIASGFIPQMTLTPVALGGEIRCWHESQMDPALYYKRRLVLGSGVSTALEFSPEKVSGPKLIPRNGNELYEPIVCEIPDGAELSAQMKYTIVSTSGVKTGIADCTSAKVVNLPEAWTFTTNPTCSKDGIINTGNLQAGAGEIPVLYLKNDSCEWDGTTVKDCSTMEVMKDHPEATLKKAQVFPVNVDLKTTSGAGFDKTINCI